MLAVLGGLVAAAWSTATRGYVAGGLALAGVCVAAAVLRLVLPTAWVGTLAVRRKMLDAVLLCTLAAAVTVLTLSVPLP
jgi:hypothetical protein